MTINTSTSLPSTPMQLIPLKAGESIKIEPQAMLACKNVELITHINGSFWKAAIWRLIGGESFLINTYTAKKDGAWVTLEEAYKGQIVAHTLTSSEPITLQRQAFVAADANVSVKPTWLSAKSWIKGLGPLSITASVQEGKEGRIFFTARNGVIKACKITKEDGPITVDNDNLLGYSGSLTATTRRLGDVKTLMYSGEGFVNEFTGDGTVFIGTTITKESKDNYVEQAINTIANQVVEAVTKKNIDLPAKMMVMVALALMIYKTSLFAEILKNSTSQNFTPLCNKGMCCITSKGATSCYFE